MCFHISATPPLTQNFLALSDAKLRLSKLMPGTEEHSKLQNALLKSVGIVEISLPDKTYKVATSSQDSPLCGGFGSSEHVAIGEEVDLKGLNGDRILLTKETASVRFEHIIALAGDFYGVVGGAISLPGGSDQEKTERFTNAFSTLFNADHNELRKIILEIKGECLAVKHAGLPHHCYSNQMIEKNNAIKKIKNNIDDLLVDNSDHFSKNAEDAYLIGHTLAMAEARLAGLTNNVEGLKKAYAIDAFACHFLTDLFAAGHIRNQRGELEIFLISQLGFSPEWAKPFAGILTGAQHEQDGNAGLNVCNLKGDNWRAYGDGNFFTPKNSVNKEKAIEAVQTSADEIYKAYQNPDQIEASTITLLIPHATEFNLPPIYSVEGNSLYIVRGNEKIQITSQIDYLNKGLAQAVRYLPQEYIDKVLSLNIELHPVIEKVIVPVVERVTGSMWNIIGLASYYQSKKEFYKINEKLNEAADLMKGVYDNCLMILERIKILDSKVDDLLWHHLIEDVKKAIQKISHKGHERDEFEMNENARGTFTLNINFLSEIFHENLQLLCFESAYW